jgi:hypothetical protein
LLEKFDPAMQSDNESNENEICEGVPGLYLTVYCNQVPAHSQFKIIS